MNYCVYIMHKDGSGGRSISSTPEEARAIYDRYSKMFSGTTTKIGKAIVEDLTAKLVEVQYD